MLPLLGGLAGAALAPTLGIGALAAGALGSGLGSYIQTGDLGKGVQAGLTAYLGGKLLGGIGADKAAVDPTATATTATAPSGGIADMGGAGVTTNPLQAPYTPPTVMDKVSAPITGLESAAPTSTPFLDREIGSLTADPILSSGGPSTVTYGDVLTKGGGAGITGMAASYEPKMPEEEKYDIPEAEPREVNLTMPGSDYVPGRGPEFDYFAASGGLMRMQEGGLASLNDKQIVDATVAAIKGVHPQPEMALGEFLNRFGEEALRDLVRSVRSGEVEAASGPAEGVIKGAGDGMEDLVPASLEGQQDVLLSEDEFVVPADVVSGLGNGSSEAGANRLYDMMDRVRQTRTGTVEQPPQINAQSMMPA